MPFYSYAGHGDLFDRVSRDDLAERAAPDDHDVTGDALLSGRLLSMRETTLWWQDEYEVEVRVDGGPPESSARQRDYYARSKNKPAPPAPGRPCYGDWDYPGGDWSTASPGPTAAKAVWKITLTQHFAASPAYQSESTWERNEWSEVTRYEEATNG